MRASPSRPRLFRGGTALSDWVLAGGRAERAPFAWRWQLRWQARWFERLKRRQDALLPTAPRTTPIVVLGLWRSGTTALHEWLAALPGHASPTTWQCFRPDSFSLVPSPPKPKPMFRPMDAGVLTAASPQEDEIALLLLGVPSLYRGFIDPRRLPDVLADADRDDQSWTADWQRFLAGVEQQHAGARLVLKSPNHSLRLTWLDGALPRSPWVWIGRPAHEIWHSNLRMWRAMNDTYALWRTPPQALDAFLEGCFERAVAQLEQLVSRAPAGRLCWIDFADLHGPQRDAMWRTVCRFVGWSGNDEEAAAVAAARPALAPTTAPVNAVSPGVASLLKRLDELQAAARSRFGWRAREVTA